MHSCGRPRGPRSLVPPSAPHRWLRGLLPCAATQPGSPALLCSAPRQAVLLRPCPLRAPWPGMKSMAWRLRWSYPTSGTPRMMLNMPPGGTLGWGLGGDEAVSVKRGGAEGAAAGRSVQGMCGWASRKTRAAPRPSPRLPAQRSTSGPALARHRERLDGQPCPHAPQLHPSLPAQGASPDTENQ